MHYIGVQYVEKMPYESKVKMGIVHFKVSVTASTEDTEISRLARLDYLIPTDEEQWQFYCGIIL